MAGSLCSVLGTCAKLVSVCKCAYYDLYEDLPSCTRCHAASLTCKRWAHVSSSLQEVLDMARNVHR